MKEYDLVLSSQGIHCMPYKNYYVVYEIEEAMNTVVVLRVEYNRRNWKWANKEVRGYK